MTLDVTEKRTRDYVRHGTTTLFAALNAAPVKSPREMHAMALTSWPS
jgi:hypothetical protein